MVSGVVIVVRLGHSHRDAVERLRTQLANVNAPVLGVVLNGSVGRRSEYEYGGGTRSSSPEAPKRAAPSEDEDVTSASVRERAAQRKPGARHGLTAQAPTLARADGAGRSCPWSVTTTLTRSATSGPRWRSTAGTRSQHGSGRPPGGTTSAGIALS